MAFFKSARNASNPIIAVNTTDNMNNSPNHSLNMTNSLNPQSNSLESPLQNQWDIDPELPRNMYMPCVGTSSITEENTISNNRIYILGSHNNNQCWVYDATYKTYEKLPYFPKKIVPKGHCVTTCDNLIFSTGGCTQSKHLLFFNTISNEWHTAPNSRAKDFGIGTKCIAIKNKKMNNSIELHVIGGNRKPNKYYIYNRALRQWREGPKLPLKLTYHGIVFVGRNHERHKKTNKKVIKAYLRHHRPQIIVFGGCNVKKGWSSSLSPTTKMYRLYLDNEEDHEEKYETDPKWKHIGDLPVAVQNFAYLCVLNNYILIFGGDLGDLKCSRNIYMYDISKRIWKLLGIKLPDHLYGMTAVETCAVNGVIHICGGHNGKSSQRLHLSIKTSTLLQKEFDDFDSSYTWKSLSSRAGGGNDDLSLLDELKRVKRKLKDFEEKYAMTHARYSQLHAENIQIKQTNLSLLDKLAEAMQEKEEYSYEIMEMNKKFKKIMPKSKKISKVNSHSHKKKKKKYKHIKNAVDQELINISNDVYNIDPKYRMFRNFLFGRIGLSQYLDAFRNAKYGNICKMVDLNDQILQLKIGISNELHRKLILKMINEFKLEILQFKTWISSYNNEPNLLEYIKVLAKHGIITWHLLAQSIENKKDFYEKLVIHNEEAIDCLYVHLCQFLDGSIPQPNPNKKIKNNDKKNEKNFNGHLGAQVMGKNNNNNVDDGGSGNTRNIINMRYNDSMANDNALFDDSGYHNW